MSVIGIPAYHSGVKVETSSDTYNAGFAILDSNNYLTPVYKGDGRLDHGAGLEAYTTFKNGNFTTFVGAAYDKNDIVDLSNTASSSASATVVIPASRAASARSSSIRARAKKPMIVGAATEVIAGEGSIVTAGGIDTHIHFICPQQIDEAISSGVTTMLGGGTGPAHGTFATPAPPASGISIVCSKPPKPTR